MDTQEKTEKKFYKRWWFWAIIIFVLYAIGSNGSAPRPSGSSVASDTEKPAPVAQPVQAISVTAIKLGSDYKQNEVAADATYKDKLLEISGTVDTIGKDVMDTPYISFAGASQYEVLDRVQCMFTKSDEVALAKVTKGQQITLRGTLSSKLGNIIVKSCSIVQP